MCRATKCRVCGKTTWAGCGQHITQIKATIPTSQWCPGHPKAETPKRLLQKTSQPLTRQGEPQQHLPLTSQTRY